MGKCGLGICCDVSNSSRLQKAVAAAAMASEPRIVCSRGTNTIDCAIVKERLIGEAGRVTAGPRLINNGFASLRDHHNKGKESKSM